MTRCGPRLHCASCKRGFTIFVGTKLGSLRKPCVQALLLGIRAIRFDHRGIAARALARQTGTPRQTIWRQMMKVREALPRLRRPREFAARVQVCGRSSSATKEFLDAHTRRLRIVAESIRTWLNGTHHGVTAKHLPMYLREWAARSAASWQPRRRRSLPGREQALALAPASQ